MGRKVGREDVPDDFDDVRSRVPELVHGVAHSARPRGAAERLQHRVYPAAAATAWGEANAAWRGGRGMGDRRRRRENSESEGQERRSESETVFPIRVKYKMILQFLIKNICKG
jgi:hypothetical protein